MSDHPVHPEPGPEPDLPAGLVEALGGLYPHRAVPVPAAVDEAVLRGARSGFARRRRFWLAARTIGAVSAAAAAIVLAVVAYRDRDRSAPSPVAASQAAVAGDVDGSGRVDVLDAYVLATKLRANPGGAPGTNEDVNHDGVLDRRDVDAVAAMAVSVAPSPRGGMR